MATIDAILLGDCLETLKTLEDESVNCCVTSPPYYALRDYGTATWVGGDPNCKHYRESKKSDKTITGHKAMGDKDQPVGDAIYKDVCPLCGAKRVDLQIGLEQTPEEYIDKLVAVFSEVYRVLKKDGTLWLNIGDSYAGSGKNGGSTDGLSNKQSTNSNSALTGITPSFENSGIKTKDLIGIPWMLAFALRKAGWYLRQDIIWQKPNPMPESVTDRCTKSHEYIFLLSKNQRYYFDYKAIQEKANYQGENRSQVSRKFGGIKYGQNDDSHFQTYSGKEWVPQVQDGSEDVFVRNKRDVWNVNIQPTKEAHFATFPQMLIKDCILAGCMEGGGSSRPVYGKWYNSDCFQVAW